MLRLILVARRVLVFAVVLATVLVVAAPANAATNFIGTGQKKWAVVLCNFKDQPNAPRSMEYWQRFFTGQGAGALGMVDYFDQVSFHQLSIANTTIIGWNNARNPSDLSKTLTRGEWQSLSAPYGTAGGAPRRNKIVACANGAQGFDFTGYWGVLAIFPEARSLTQSAIDNDDTTVTLQGIEHFPDGSAPFLMNIGTDSALEVVRVTGRSGNVLTIVRGQGGSTAKAHAAGEEALVQGDLGGVGTGQRDGTQIGGKTYSIANVVLPHQTDVEITAHELGHGSGYDHSRALSYSTNDYGDATDVMSARGPSYMSFSADSRARQNSNFQANSGDNFGYVDEPSYFGSSLLGGQPGSKGPGLTAINLDKQGWIPGPRHFTFSPPNQATVTLHALGDAEALTSPADHMLEARVPVAVTIQNKSAPGANGAPLPPSIPAACGAPNACTTSDYYSIEYRERVGFDRGFSGVTNNVIDPRNGVVLHLKGKDEMAYWVNQTPAGVAVPHSGVLFAGDEYVDAPNNTYAAVLSTGGANHSARVAIGSQKLGTKAGWSGATSVDYSDQFKLAGDLTLDPGGDAIREENLAVTAGSTTCSGATNVNGHFECTRNAFDKPGSYTATVHYDGNAAFKAADVSVPFTINRETTKTTYTGATTSDYHDPFTASLRVVDSDSDVGIANLPVTLTLGASDSCSATTDFAGEASCQITPNQVPGPYSITASFAGDDYYIGSSDTKPFLITKQQTSVTYDGPSKVANDFPVTLTGTLTEEEVGGAPVSGRTVAFTLGSGFFAQTCSGTTDLAGKAECTIASVAQPATATTVPVAVTFTGDAYYLPSDAAATLKLLYYTGRAYGASSNVLGLPVLPPQADTGSIQTSVRSSTTRSALFAVLPPITGTGLTGSVTTGLGTSTSRGTATSVSIGLPGVPVIQATGIEATSTSTCTGATGTTKILGLKVAGLAVNLSAGPSVIKAGKATIRINEQQPVPGADQGLTVYALHISVPGVADVIVGAARSDIHNC